MVNLKNKSYIKWLLSILSGVLLSISWPEIGGQTYLIFFAFIPLLHIAKNTETYEWRTLFLFSFLSFLIWHITTDYWMIFSTVLGSITAWLINSFMMAAVVSIAYYSAKKLKYLPIELILAFYWLSFEILHLFWDLSWPWMSLGNVFSNNIEWIQWYEYLGLYGGAFWVIITNGFIYRVVSSVIAKERKNAIYSLVFVLFIIIAPIFFSHYLLHKELTVKKELVVSVVQPNFDTYTEKFEGMSPLEQSKRMLDQMKAIKNPVDICVLPETAIPENIDENLEIYPQSIQFFLDRSKQFPYPVLGSYYSHNSTFSYNTAALFENGEINQVRHKSKLVPFAETLPFEFVSRNIKSIIAEEGGMGFSYTKDHEARVFSMTYPQKAILGTLICFESVFPDYTAEMTRHGAEFFIIITNDDWWKNTPGHLQHFAFARVHAISNRRPIARAANTGISGFIDAWGRIIQKSNYREEIVLTETLITPEYNTFYSKYEEWIRWFVIIVSGSFFVFAVVTPKSN